MGYVISFCREMGPLALAVSERRVRRYFFPMVLAQNPPKNPKNPPKNLPQGALMPMPLQWRIVPGSVRWPRVRSAPGRHPSPRTGGSKIFFLGFCLKTLPKTLKTLPKPPSRCADAHAAAAADSPRVGTSAAGEISPGPPPVAENGGFKDFYSFSFRLIFF